MRRVFCVLTIVLVVSSQAFAWSAAGHKIVASIAFARLTPEQQGKVVALLREHPRFKVDFEDKHSRDATDDNSRNESYFQEASIWPDVARGFRGEDAKYHHGTWHYINLPHFFNDA